MRTSVFKLISFCCVSSMDCLSKSISPESNISRNVFLVSSSVGSRLSKSTLPKFIYSYCNCDSVSLVYKFTCSLYNFNIGYKSVSSLHTCNIFALCSINIALNYPETVEHSIFLIHSTI